MTQQFYDEDMARQHEKLTATADLVAQRVRTAYLNFTRRTSFSGGR